MLSHSGAAEVALAPPHECTAGESEVSNARFGEAPIDPRGLVRELKAFAGPNGQRSGFELAVTLVPFLLLCGTMLVAVEAGYLFSLVLTVPAGLLLLRLFLIQHDCGHGSFFLKRASNDRLGRVLGVLTLTPYDCWRRSHALHHAGTGNLDARGFGDVDTLTVREYQSLSRFGKLRYRAYRHPLVLFGIGPAYLFLLRHRLPIGVMNDGWIYWVSAMATNAATALLLAGLAYFFGAGVVTLTLLPVLLIAASLGVWLFYIQHQFAETHWDHGTDWSFHDAALFGSSHLDLPPVLRWFTANIGIHHVHHLVSRIPFYRLPDVLTRYPHLEGMNRFKALDTLATLRLVLWDEDRRQLVSFRRARQISG